MSSDKALFYGRQCIDDADVVAVAEALRGDWLTQGPTVERFEVELAEFCGARHAVAVTNGTMALQLAYRAAGLGTGDEVITTPITFFATCSTMLHAGARPIFVDIEPGTWNLDPSRIEAAITSRTKAIVPVHFAGLPCNLRAIRELAERHDLTIIEDGCHALGATFEGHRIGASPSGAMTCFSFHPVKHLTTGEGGAVLTDDDELAEQLRLFRHHGITRDPKRLENCDGPWYYEAHELGYNARLTDFQCALGLSQLKKLDRFVERRQEIAARYRDELAMIPELTVQTVPSSCTHAYHLFVIHLNKERYDRLAVFKSLKEVGINTQIHYIPMTRHPIIRQCCETSSSLPEAERYYAGCLSLPMYPTLSDDDVTRVVNAVIRACVP